MKTRFKNGKAVADIYSRNEHGIAPGEIDKDAVSVVKRLNGAGFDAYIVGGAVRDLMLGRKPKDFDVVTAASPRQVHRLFRNSRIIGRRFKIVHVVFGDKIIEVSTFRSLKDHTDNNDNIFGTIEEDCQRRDFSINSLYYDPFEETVIDMTGAMSDFRSRRIRSLIPLNRTFIEDPVRMIRCLKYCVTTGFKMDFKLRMAIRKYSSNLSSIGSSRMTEELNKILACGKSAQILKLLNQYGLLVFMLPCLSVYAQFPQVFQSLEELDRSIESHRKVSRSEMYLALVKPVLTENPDIRNANEKYKDVYRQIKVFITPNTPCNSDLEEAAHLYLNDTKPKAKKPRKSKPARKSEKEVRTTH